MMATDEKCYWPTPKRQAVGSNPIRGASSTVNSLFAVLFYMTKSHRSEYFQAVAYVFDRLFE